VGKRWMGWVGCRRGNMRRATGNTTHMKHAAGLQHAVCCYGPQHAACLLYTMHMPYTASSVRSAAETLSSSAQVQTSGISNMLHTQ
jgi:hypothetical protein